MSIGRFERMVGITEDEYRHLKSLQRTNDPLQNKFLSLSNDYKRQEFINNPYVRVQRQGETLGQMIKVKDSLRQHVVDATPKPYKARTQSLFHFIADKISVNARGELYDKDGAIIEGSNIADLIQHAVRDRRRNMTPAGWSRFLDILRVNNAPRMILNYDTLDEMQSQSKSSPVIKKGTLPSRIPVLKKEPSYDPDRFRQYLLSLKKEKKEKKTSPFKAPRSSSRTRKAPNYFISGTKKKYV